MKEIGLEWQVVDTPINLKEVSSVSTPNANKLKLYAKDEGGVSTLCIKNDAGGEVCLPTAAGTLPSGGGTGNRLAYWTAATVLDDLSALTPGRVMFPDSNGLPTGSASLFWDSGNTRLGIGTSSPSFLTHIQSETTAQKLVIDNYNDTFATIINLRSARNTLASPSSINAADIGLGRISFSGWHSGGAFSNQSAIIQAVSAEAFTSSAQGCTLRFMTTAIGATTVTERWRITDTGILRGNDSAVVQGGTAAAATLTLQATSGVGAGSEQVLIKAGSNGGTQVAMFSSNSSTSIQFGSVTGETLFIRDIVQTTWNFEAGVMRFRGTHSGTTVANGAGCVFAFDMEDDGNNNISNVAYLGPAWEDVTTDAARFSFFVKPGGSSAVERWRITSAGVWQGRTSGGSTIQGGSASGDDLTLSSTSNATKGFIYFGGNGAYDEAEKVFGANTQDPFSITARPGFCALSDSNAVLQLRSHGAGASLALFQSARGTIASPAALNSLDNLFVFNAYGQYDTTVGHFNLGAQLSAQAVENFSGTAAGTAWIFSTCAATSVSLVERLRIGDTGKLTVTEVGTGDAISITKSAGTGNVGLTLQQTGGSWVPRFHMIGDRDVANMNIQFTGSVYSGSNVNSGTIFRGQAARGSFGSPSAISSGDVLFQLVGDGYNSSAFTSAGMAAIRFYADETFTTTANGTRMQFETTAIGASTPTSRLTLQSDGGLEFSANAFIQLIERTTTPSNPSSGAECNIYMKADKLIVQYNRAGTVRYKYLDLDTAANQSWIDTTSAP